MKYIWRIIAVVSMVMFWGAILGWFDVPREAHEWLIVSIIANLQADVLNLKENAGL